MVFNATFNNISVLLVAETGVPGKNTDLSQIADKLYHMLYRVHLELPYNHDHDGPFLGYL